MDADFTPAEQEFQAAVETFFQTDYPQDVLQKVHRHQRLSKDDFVRSQKALHARGWAGINWPVEYGGTGWSATEQYIFHNVAAHAGMPRIVPFGLNMVGPVIYSYGSEEQKARFLPDILASNVWWCQGYSEPGAGSDLASLKTRAERDGDHYILNGTKTWTTLAQHADWIFLLARTDPDAPRKQEGISFLVADMTTPGITVRPIITLDGEHEVNEVHFENARIPVENLIGDEGRGWSYGKVLLQHERTNIAGVANSKVMLERLQKLANEPPLGGAPMIEDAAFARKIARLGVELKALEFTELRTLADVAAGQAPGPQSSLLKIKGTEIQQRLRDLHMELAGYYALPFVQEQFESDDVESRIGGLRLADTAPVYFNYRKVSIYGGSNEIQRNIVAKRVMGL